MKERVDPERSHDFKRTFLLASSLALFLALLFLGFYYGCAKSSRPERPSTPPRPSGMTAQRNNFAPISKSFADDKQFACAPISKSFADDKQFAELTEAV